MSNVNQLLDKRFKKEKTEKMNELAKRSTSGQLSGFSGVFKINPLSDHERNVIENILIHYGEKEADKAHDLSHLSALTSELKAINNQAILLHGERIKKAQSILKKYRDGAFTAWLMLTYGNRQTPYNFLQYYEFYHTLPQSLRDKMDEMPKQAIYTLASREGEQEIKENFIQNYQGETKQAILEKIRVAFPLKIQDKRKQNLTRAAISSLEKLLDVLRQSPLQPSEKEKNHLNRLLSQIMARINQEGQF